MRSPTRTVLYVDFTLAPSKEQKIGGNPYDAWSSGVTDKYKFAVSKRWDEM